MGIQINAIKNILKEELDKDNIRISEESIERLAFHILVYIGCDLDFIKSEIKNTQEGIKEAQEVIKKECDNLILIIDHLYYTPKTL